MHGCLQQYLGKKMQFLFILRTVKIVLVTVLGKACERDGVEHSTRNTQDCPRTRVADHRPLPGRKVLSLLGGSRGLVVRRLPGM